MDIIAAVTRGKSEDFLVETIQIDDPRPGEVRVKVIATGMCHTDLVVRDQYLPVPLPAVLGHEAAGIVDAVGEGVKKLKPGDHVVMTFDSCHQCPSCYEGDTVYCENFLGINLLSAARPDGSTTLSRNNEVIHSNFFQQSSFASYAMGTEDSVVKVTKDVELEILGPLGCGIQTGAGAVMNSLAPEAGSTIAIFGAGSVGLSAIMAARIVGCTIIIAVDIMPSRLKIALELGATHTLNPQDGDIVEAIHAITGGGVNYSLEATAIPAVFCQAVDSLAVRGVCGLIGLPPAGTKVSLDMVNLLLGRTVRGIIEGDSKPDTFIPKLIELYRQGRFPFDKLIKFYDLKDINQAAHDSETGLVIKPIIRMPH
ncbi:alcohol dehydrogenase [Marinobacter psychrophilus]|jgi:aryl-alcohol dehydrogenase|uniref:Alcohol dehydrogenase n=1 Tax=Marinobacter psychrophilus TaxID=330734 RepID=A0A0H4I417_9GAMM|nr:NAD(P)-dependent alcohol dehydrogenase [Marinobacter psychrophilus]AKO52440.1 alcohol dehydrogenase [Marinobacter psychrophilus]